MNQSLIITRLRSGPILAMVLPLGLWALLWFSIPGEEVSVKGLGHPEDPVEFLIGISSILPFVAAAVALAVTLGRFAGNLPTRVSLFGPLGLITVYGTVGLVSAFFSPNGSVALYWAVVYLSVPLVLWAVITTTDGVEQIQHVIRFTWLILSLAVVILLVFAFTELGFWSFISNPSSWLDCSQSGWFEASSHRVRQTGVGRYAAVVAIISLNALWQRNWRFLWGPVLLSSVVLLLFSGARTSLVGFILAAPLVVLLHEGKRGLVAGGIATILLVPIFWGTGIHQTFLNNCIWRSQTAEILQVQTSASIQEPQYKEDQVYGRIPAEILQVQTSASIQEPQYKEDQVYGRIPDEFFTFSGRTEIWAQVWVLFKKSPLLGHGFHADRLILSKHTHNSYLHSLLQTGLLGGIPFMAGLGFAWILLLEAFRNLNRFPAAHKQLLIGTAGVLIFLAVRTITESTGAFFGVDWLLLCPLLVYVQIVNKLPDAEQRTV